MSSPIHHPPNPSGTTGHPGAQTLAEFAQGKLEEARLGEIEAHLDECPSCCQSLRELSQRQDRFVAELVSAAKAVDLAAGSTGRPTSGGQSDTPSSTGAARYELPRTIGRFQVRKEIGHGGFGVVLLAYDPQLRREVAVKIPRLGALLTPELRERFLREAQAAAALDHPHIVPIHEAGEADGVCYIASGYCRGPNLAAWLRQRTQPVAFDTAAWLVSDIAGAVAHAHARGVLHRDLKPSNVLLERKDEGETETDENAGPAAGLDLHASNFTPKISDFGLAKMLSDGPDTTLSDIVMGTASYMSPEQARGKTRQIGPPADVYALGAILYQLLTGRAPFTGESELETLQQVQNQEVVPPRRLRPKTPSDLQTICLKCLEKEPARRYHSAAELAGDLSRFRNGEPIRARPVGRIGKAWRWCRRNGAVAALAACLVTALILIPVGSAWMSLRLGREARRAVAAEQTSKRSLWHAYLARARAMRASQASGQRFAALAVLREAEAISHELQIDSADLQRLRDEAIAAMGLADLQVDRRWKVPAAQLDPRRVAFDAALATVALIDDGGAIIVRSLSRNAPAERLPLPAMPCTRVALSDDGSLIAAKVADEPGLVLCILADAAPQSMQQVAKKLEVRGTGDGRSFLVGSLSAGDEEVACFCFVPQSRDLLIVGQQGAVSKLKCETGEVEQLGTAQLQAQGCCLDSGGSRLAVWGGASLHVFDLLERRVTWRLHHGRSPQIETAAWSPDGQQLATGGSHHVAYLWQHSDEEPRILVTGHQSWVTNVAFSPDGYALATCSSDGTTRLSEVSTGKPLVVARGCGIRFGRQGRQLGGVLGESVVRFQVADGAERRRLSSRQRTHDVSDLAFSTDGQLLATYSYDGTVWLWNAVSGEPIKQIDSGVAQWVAFRDQPAALQLVVGCYSEVRTWDVEFDSSAGQLSLGRPKIVGLPAGLECCRVSSLARHVDRMALGDGEGCAAVIDPENPLAKPIVIRDRQALKVALSPDGRWLATYGRRGGGVHIRDAATSETVRKMLGDATVHSAAFSPDRKRLVLDTGDRLMFYSVGPWTESHRIVWDDDTGPQRPGIAMSFTADGGLLAISRAAFDFKLIRPADGTVVATLPNEVLHAPVALSPNGSRLACCGWGFSVQMWNLSRVFRQLEEIGLGSGP